MKRIIGILGSPRSGGNTEVLLKAAEQGVKDAGGAFEIVRLAAATVGECDGCHVCWTGKSCAKNDAMNDIYPRIAEADGVVFGTPVYWYGPTALMKAFIDRFMYFNCESNRPMIRGKAAATIIPFEETALDTGAPTAAFFERSLSFLEMSLVEQLLVPGVTRRGEVKHRSEFMDQAVALGRKLARSGEPS